MQEPEPEPFSFECGGRKAREGEIPPPAPFFPTLQRLYHFLKSICWWLLVLCGGLFIALVCLDAPIDGRWIKDGFDQRRLAPDHHKTALPGPQDHLKFDSHLTLSTPDPNCTALKAIDFAAALPSNHPHSIDALAAYLSTANDSVNTLVTFAHTHLACAVHDHPYHTEHLLSTIRRARHLTQSSAARYSSLLDDWFRATAPAYRAALSDAALAVAAATPSVQEKTAYAWRVWPGLFGFVVGDAAAVRVDRAQQVARGRWERAHGAWEAHQAGGTAVEAQQKVLVAFAADLAGWLDLVADGGLGRSRGARAALKTVYFERVVRPAGVGWDRFEDGWRMLRACGQGRGGNEPVAGWGEDGTQKTGLEGEDDGGQGKMREEINNAEH